MDTAKLVMSSVAPLALRTGLKAANSISTAAKPHANTAIKTASQNGCPVSIPASNTYPVKVINSPWAKLIRPSTLKTTAKPRARSA